MKCDAQARGCEGAASRGAIHGANCRQLPLVEPATPESAPLELHVSSHAQGKRAIPKPSAVGSSPTGGIQVRAMIDSAEHTPSTRRGAIRGADESFARFAQHRIHLPSQG